MGKPRPDVAARCTKHGRCRTREYRCWVDMRSRVLTKSNDAYKDYGARGISICERWSDFSAFFEDMGPSPTKAHTLDRINVNGNYEPGNCRWATPREQAINRRDTILLTYNGETMCMKDWARKLGMSYITLGGRIRSGWPVEKALTTPVAHKHRPKDESRPEQHVNDYVTTRVTA